LKRVSERRKATQEKVPYLADNGLPEFIHFLTSPAENGRGLMVNQLLDGGERVGGQQSGGQFVQLLWKKPSEKSIKGLERRV